MATDADLVNVVLNGGQRAYAELVARYEKSVLAITYDILRNHHAAEDAAQDAFVACYKSLPSLRNPAAFRGYLFKVAVREAKHRSRDRRAVSALGADIVSPDTRLPPDHTRLLAAVSDLPAASRELISLHHFDGHDMATCARLLNRSIGTVTKQLSRIYARLRERLKEDSR